MQHFVLKSPRSWLAPALLLATLSTHAQTASAPPSDPRPGAKPQSTPASPSSALTQAPAAPAAARPVETIVTAPVPSTTLLRLSRQQAIANALAGNPALAAARAQVEEARAAVVMAGAWADPSFLVDVTGQSSPIRPSFSAAHDLGVGVTVPFPGRTTLRRDVATADLRAAEFNVAQLRQQLASQAAQAYDAILIAQRHREDLEQARTLAADFVDKTQSRFLAGTVPRVDVIKAKTDLAAADNDLIANERAIATARASLNRLLGRMGGAPIEPTDTLDVPPAIPQVETLEQLAAASRPEIQSLTAQLEGARKATRLASEFWAPDLNFTVTQQTVQGFASTYTTGLTVGLPLFFRTHQRGEVAQARHREEELTANIADIRAQVSLDVQTAYTQASTALRQAIFIRDELLPEAREVYRVASVSYGLGGSSALDLLDAKRTLLDAETQYVDALGAANDAVAALELATGAPLPQPAAGEKP